MLTELARQHEAHKAVRQRIAMAAERHKSSKVENKLVEKLASVETKPSTPRESWFHIVESEPKAVFSITEIQQAVCRHFGIQLADLRRKRRCQFIVKRRQIAMYLCKEHTIKSQPEIGRMFGGFDHTTVLHAYRSISDLIHTDWMIAYDVAHIEGLLA
jgi:chromosomal replication initiation ATPase DnaA